MPRGWLGSVSAKASATRSGSGSGTRTGTGWGSGSGTPSGSASVTAVGDGLGVARRGRRGARGRRRAGSRSRRWRSAWARWSTRSGRRRCAHSEPRIRCRSAPAEALGEIDALASADPLGAVDGDGEIARKRAGRLRHGKADVRRRRTALDRGDAIAVLPDSRAVDDPALHDIRGGRIGESRDRNRPKMRCSRGP